jgi:hypothetical protein
VSDDGAEELEEIAPKEVLTAFGVISGEHSVNETVQIRGLGLEKMQDGEWWAIYDDEGEINDIIDFSEFWRAQSVISWCHGYALALTTDDIEEPEPPQRNRRELQ